MALYRCAACGSPNVVVGSQKEGYDYVKGAIGTFVLGAGGAVAGVNGKSKRVFKCPDCGLTLDSPMSNEIKVMIDLGLMSEAARNNLTLSGVKIDWNTLTGKYKNIEKSYVDEQIAEKAAKEASSISNDKDILTKKATATQEEFDEAIETFFAIKAKDGYFKREDRIYSKDHPITKEEYEGVIKAISVIVENFYKFFPPDRYNISRKYNNYDIYIDDIFNAYVVLYYYNATSLPFFHTDGVIQYIVDSNPFVGAFVRQYMNNRSDFGGWIKSPFGSGRIYTCHTFSLSSPEFFVECSLKDAGDSLGRYKSLVGDYELSEIWLPRFAILDDKLCYWEKSFKDSAPIFEISFKDLMENYFNNNNDKRAEFDDYLKGTEELFVRYDSLNAEKESIASDRKKHEKKVKKLTSDNSDINNKISANNLEIDRLNRKIFFRSKADEQIAVLQKENEEYNITVKKNKDAIKDLNKKIEDSKELFTILTRVENKLQQELLNGTLQGLFVRMDNFIDWTVSE